MYLVCCGNCHLPLVVCWCEDTGKLAVYVCDFETGKKSVMLECQRILKMLRSWALCCQITKNNIIIKC